MATGFQPDQVTDRSALAVVVGSVSDEHLLAVINRLPMDDVAIFDAETLSGADFLLLPGSVRIGELQFSAAKPVRGWLRRREKGRSLRWW